MFDLLSYSGINTKIKAMDSNLIPLAGYHKIAQFDSIADFIVFLKSHPGYKKIFRKYDEQQLHRGEAEQIFVNALYLDFEKIYRFANEEQRKDLELIFFRYEVNILKTYIRYIFQTAEDDTKGVPYVSNEFYPFFEKHSKIDLEALSSSHTMEEFVQHLRNTEYYTLFERLQNTNHTTAFDYETQLDNYYFTKTWKLVDKKLSGFNKKAFTKRLGTEIDLLNIMWIYRSKQIYQMDASDIMAVIIPVNYKLSKDQLFQLANASTIAEFMARIKTTYYNEMIYSSLEVGTLEKTHKTILSNIYKTNKAKYPSSMAAANFYLYQKEGEISNLTTALECIRYGLEPQEKLQYILQK